MADGAHEEVVLVLLKAHKGVRDLLRLTAAALGEAELPGTIVGSYRAKPSHPRAEPPYLHGATPEVVAGMAETLRGMTLGNEGTHTGDAPEGLSAGEIAAPAQGGLLPAGRRNDRRKRGANGVLTTRSKHRALPLQFWRFF